VPVLGNKDGIISEEQRVDTLADEGYI